MLKRKLKCLHDKEEFHNTVNATVDPISSRWSVNINFHHINFLLGVQKLSTQVWSDLANFPYMAFCLNC